jgi:hypothetical protein
MLNQGWWRVIKMMMIGMIFGAPIADHALECSAGYQKIVINDQGEEICIGQFGQYCSLHDDYGRVQNQMGVCEQIYAGLFE